MTVGRRLLVDLPDLGATFALGRGLAALARAGDVLLLRGPLGAGKTALVRGLGTGLGVRGAVTSPMFVLAREHRAGRSGGLGLVHVDAYRLRGDDADAPAGTPVQDALADLDLPTQTAVTAVEWGEGLGPVLADEWLEVALVLPAPGRPRRAELRAVGASWADRLPLLETA